MGAQSRAKRQRPRGTSAPDSATPSAARRRIVLALAGLIALGALLVYVMRPAEQPAGPGASAPPTEAEAIAKLQEAIRVGPYNEAERYSLGALMEQHATPDEMVAYYTHAVASDPKPQTSTYFWAIGLERRGDTA